MAVNPSRDDDAAGAAGDEEDQFSLGVALLAETALFQYSAVKTNSIRRFWRLPSAVEFLAMG